MYDTLKVQKQDIVKKSTHPTFPKIRTRRIDLALYRFPEGHPFPDVNRYPLCFRIALDNITIQMPLLIPNLLQRYGLRSTHFAYT